MKLLFVYYHPKPNWWLDGLRMALRELESDWDITYFNLFSDDYPSTEFDFALGWGAFGSPADCYLQNYKGNCGLCLAGNATPVPKHHYSVIFYETDWVLNNYLPESVSTNYKKAFGVNTELFSQAPIATPIVFDYLGVGSFSLWKRWDRMKSKSGIKMIVGEYQRDNKTESNSIITDLVSGGVMVSPLVHPFDLANLYHWSRTVYIPADINGGGERSIWEARSCGCEVEVESDNPKLQELVTGEVKDYVWYAEQLKEGVELCL